VSRIVDTAACGATERAAPSPVLCGMNDPTSAAGDFPPRSLAVVVGASGAIGGALLRRLERDHRFEAVHGLSRAGEGQRMDLLDEPSIETAASLVAADAAARGLDVRLVIDATGFLHGDGFAPEKALRQVDPAHMAHAFALNAIGPALLLKHFLPLLPREGRAVFATLSARVASIGENVLGGWYSYRASKAALNQIVRTAAAELKRRQKEACCVALHPGHVASPLSAPFGAGGHPTLEPDDAADRLMAVIDALEPNDTGGFFDGERRPIPW
jgi:NAD(P)-dependent dehydrogenase (short-subunit alcohol dehydrogenase family)